METKGKEQFVDVHYVNTAVPCVVEEYYVGFPESHEDQVCSKIQFWCCFEYIVDSRGK